MTDRISPLPNVHTSRYFLTAGECNAEGKLPLTLLVRQCIDVATMHANILGVGYDRLIADGMAWVLSRISLSMSEWPGINSRYSISTWVESYNRRFSERLFEINIDIDGREHTIGYGRSVWMAIDIMRRQSGSIEALDILKDVAIKRECDIDAWRPVAINADSPDVSVSEYTFRYTDCDFNRHVNTARYIEVLLNRWPLEWHDTHRIDRFDIAFMHEAYYGETAQVVSLPPAQTDTPAALWLSQINGPDGTPLTRARFIVSPCQQNHNI